MPCPPRGHGVWARALPTSVLAQFDSVGLLWSRSRSAGQAQELLDRGVEVWATSGPGDWTPRGWASTLPRIMEWAQRLGVRGIMPDPEDNWRNASAGQAARLGEALRVASGDVDVCVSSFPLLPHRRALWGPLKGHASAIVQLYGKNWPADFLAQWFADWEEMVGSGSVGLGVSLWASSPRNRGIAFSTINTPPSYRAYLDSLPGAVGAYGWPPPERIAGWRLREYLDWSPSRGLGPLTGLGCVLPSTTEGVILAVGAVVVVVAVLALLLRRP